MDFQQQISSVTNHPSSKWTSLAFLCLYITFFVLSILSMKKYDCHSQTVPEDDKPLYRASFVFAFIIIFILAFCFLIVLTILLTYLRCLKISVNLIVFILISTILLSIAICPAFLTIFFNTEALSDDTKANEKVCTPHQNEKGQPKVKYQIPLIVLGSIAIFLSVLQCFLLFRK
jgi:uncharacterized membrane protein